MNVQHCIVAGCIYSALYWVKRPVGKTRTINNNPVPVCRKCMEDLVSSYGWKYVRHMTKEERNVRKDRDQTTTDQDRRQGTQGARTL